ncbi:hypothetical protein PTE_01822 [Photorhabdus khanii NC19]|uniref:Uncharacterized protein n=1 Tax=Photorhabdus khanii NC19 TaxID=1004151 RepID=W3VAL4_9GAMM|nr:hypothetical protein [Photorhabdus khanii]ETS32064.1 hypothetical protein PTE_01822 [Photorhabdus khanii NC19]
MNANKQFFWFLMNAVLMCIFIVPVAVAFWLSAFAAGFDWNQWVKLAVEAANRAASDPAKALGTVQTYWGIFSFFLLAAYSLMFKFKANANKEKEAQGAIRPANEVGVLLRTDTRDGSSNQ